MSDAATPEPAPAPKPRPRGRRWRFVVMALLIFVILIAAVYEFGRAWLVRNRVIAILESTGLHVTNIRITDATPWHAQVEDLVAGPDGAVKVSRISIDYSPQRLFHSRVDRITVSGADLSSTLIDIVKKNAGSGTGSDGASAPAALPVGSIEVESSKINIGTGEHALVVPIHGKFSADADRYSIALQADLDPKPLKISAVVHRSDVAGAIDSEAFDIENIEKILHQFMQNPPELSGWCGTRIVFAIQNGTGSVTATFKPDALNLFATNGSKLHLESGVITFNRTIAPNAQAGTITLENVNVSSSSADFSAKGVRGIVAIARVAPFQTPGDQTITVQSLTSGKVSLTDGSVVFHAEDEHNVIIREARWQSMGGVVSSENAKVDPARSSADFTVLASDVELGQLLEVLGQGKVSGHGKVTATIPLRIHDESIELGEGAVTAQPGGILHVADAKAIADTLAASDPRFASGGPYANLKNDLAQAMADFEFQTLRADITRGENGLRADVHLAGRGRTGSKRAYDFELRISGIDRALALALGLRNAFEGK